jgi:hypothetical protein
MRRQLVRTMSIENLIVVDFRPLYRSGAATLTGGRGARRPVRPPHQVLGSHIEGVAEADEVFWSDTLDHVLFPLPDQGAGHADDLCELRDT